MTTTKYYLKNSQLAELYDKTIKTKGKYKEYLYWLFIIKCFPKLNLSIGSWRICMSNIFTPYIYNRT